MYVLPYVSMSVGLLSVRDNRGRAVLHPGLGRYFGKFEMLGMKRVDVADETIPAQSAKVLVRSCPSTTSKSTFRMSVSQLVLLAVLAVADGKRAGFSEAHTQHSLATDGEKAFNDCTEEEYTSLCRLSSAGELQKLSRGCTKLTWTFAVKEDETAECLTKDVPGLSNKCAKCFAATAAYGASNCKFGCSSAGPA
eukprot:s29_g12.t1